VVDLFLGALSTDDGDSGKTSVDAGRGWPLNTACRYRLFLTLTVLLAGVAVVLADFLARQAYVKIFSRPHGRIAHPIYDHGFSPNTTWSDKYGPYEVPYFSNSLGFRDGRIREVPLDSGRPRVILIGDSFTDGVGVAWEETFAGHLEKRLDAQGVDVLNAGCNSYTPILERIKLRYWIGERGLRVDRVILFLDLSDVKDEQFYEEDKQGRARLIPYGPFAASTRWGTKVEEWSEMLENLIEPNFVVLGAISRNLKIWVRKLARQELGKRGLFTNQAPPRWILEWEEYEGPERPVIEAGIQKLKANIGELARYLRERGIPLTLVVYPYPFHVVEGRADRAIQKIWSTWCAANGIDFIDLFPEFVGIGSGSETVKTYYLEGDCHWNAKGHERVAEALLKNPEKILPFRSKDAKAAARP